MRYAPTSQANPGRRVGSVLVKHCGLTSTVRVKYCVRTLSGWNNPGSLIYSCLGVRVCGDSLVISAAL